MATHTHQHDHDHDHGHSHPPHDSPPPSSYSDPGAESLNQALRSGFNVLRVLMIALLLAYAASGWFKINPNEQGLIVRFGKLRENAAADSQMPSRHVFGPGSHFSLPDPFDQKIRVSVATETFRNERFCFQIMPDSRGKSLESIMPQVDKLTPGVQGAMFSGDRNLSHAVFTLEYRVIDAEKFVRNVGEDVREDAQRLLRHFADDAVTRVAAGLPVERLLRQGKTDQADFALDVRRQMNEMLTQFDAGLEVNKVTPDTIEPGMVRQAFLGVTRVQNEAKQAEAEARAERERTLGSTAGAKERYEALLKAIDEFGAAQALNADEQELAKRTNEIDALLETAEGEVARVLGAAQAEASMRRDALGGEYEKFVKYRDAYRKFPVVTAVRLWAATRSAVLSNKGNEIFYVPNGGTIEIITNRDEERQRMIEEARLKAQSGL